MLIPKSYKKVSDIGTDPMDGDSMMRPLHADDAIVGSVIVAASSRGDHEEVIEHAGGVTIRRFVSFAYNCDTVASFSYLRLQQ